MILDDKVRSFRKKTFYDRFKKNNSNLFVRRLRQNILYILIMLFFLFIGALLFLFKPGVGYQILLNGEHIGFTKNPSQIRQAFASLEQDLKASKGQDIDFEKNLQFVRGKLGNHAILNPDDFKVIVSSSVEVKKPAYILKTDEGVAFAIESKEAMQSILDGLKNQKASGKKDAIAEIASNYSLVYASEVPVDKIYNYNQALSYINSNTDDTKPKFDVKVTYTDTSTRSIKRGVTTTYSDSMYDDESTVKSEGSDGIKSVENKITEINGQIVNTVALAEKVIKAPVDKVIVKGTKPRIPPVLTIASRYLGVPYVWGGTSPSGFDCSGFVQYVYAQRGVYLPRTTYSQIYSGTRVSRSNLMPGDLVFFGYGSPDHVGIYTGSGMMIHAPRPGKSVEYASIDIRPFMTGTRVQ